MICPSPPKNYFFEIITVELEVLNLTEKTYNFRMSTSIDIEVIFDLSKMDKAGNAIRGRWVDGAEDYKSIGLETLLLTVVLGTDFVLLTDGRKFYKADFISLKDLKQNL